MSKKKTLKKYKKSAKAWRKQAQYLEKKIRDLQAWNRNRNLENENLQATIEHLRLSIREWRTRYETVMSNPEIKADTEGAFTRGVQHQQAKYAAWAVATGVRPLEDQPEPEAEVIA